MEGFTPRDHAKIAGQISEIFQQSFFDARQGWGDPTEKPVFVVGMPRSGTSLVEKILASHPDVFGAGERPNIAAMAADLEKGMTAFYGLQRGSKTAALRR